jgi:hypothetical protein
MAWGGGGAGQSGGGRRPGGQRRWLEGSGNSVNWFEGVRDGRGLTRGLVTVAVD